MFHRVIERQINGVCDHHKSQGRVSCYCGMSAIDIRADLAARRRGIGRPADLPQLRVYAERKPHGTRLRYVSGCKCAACRRANSDYENARCLARRRGDWNGFVPAGPARQHILRLSRYGIGFKRVAALAGVSRTVVLEIRQGRNPVCRARTARKILAVTKDSPAAAALVDGARTNKLLRLILAEGFTKTWVAKKLGSKAQHAALQIRPGPVTARSAAKVENLWREINT